MKRRDFITASLAAPLLARAQAPRLRRVALASPGRPNPQQPSSVIQRLEELGWVEGRTIEYLRGYANDDAKRWEPMIVDLLARKPDVLVVVFTAMAQVAMKQTKDVPIVFAISSNPEKQGLVASLARPGGSVTGMASLYQDTSAKRLELLLTVVPKLPRVAVLANPAAPYTASALRNLEVAARQAKVDLLRIEPRTAEEIDGGFARIAQEKVKAVVVVGEPLVFRQRKQISDLALKYGVASVYPAKEHVEAGGLLSYGMDLADSFRRAAGHADKILKGAKPGDLPIQQATKFELVINLKTAKALGVTIPQSLLLRADRVIE